MIFLYKETNILYGYIEIESREHWDESTKTKICQKCRAYMADIIMISKALDISIDFLVSDENKELNEMYIHEINIKLNRMDEIELFHVNKYIELYNETEKKKINLTSE